MPLSSLRFNLLKDKLKVVSAIPQTAEDYLALGSVFKERGYAEEAQWYFDKATEINGQETADNVAADNRLLSFQKMV